MVDFSSYSPAAALEWRGYATVKALTVLATNDMLVGRPGTSSTPASREVVADGCG